jgi:hypothetical protein
LSARLELWVTSEQAALDLTHELVGERFARPHVIAHRGGTLTIAWRQRGEAFDHATADEQPDHVTVTVHERFDPVWTEDGHPIAFAGPDMFRLGTARIELAQPLGDRRLVDGATGRAPDDLSIWEYQEKEERAQVLRARLRHP